MAKALKVVGVMQVQVRYGSYSGDHLMYVVSGMGLHCSVEIGCRRYVTMKEFSAKLVVKLGARPRFHHPHSVPYITKGAIEQELDRLVKTGMVEKVSHAAWATPIVGVPKWDGTVHLCGDYKIMVNKELDIDQYPLPRTEDLRPPSLEERKFPSWTY